MERCQVYFLQERSNHKTRGSEKEAREEEGGSEEVREFVSVCVFLARALKFSSLLLPDILRYHGYRLAGDSPALSASLTLC